MKKILLPQRPSYKGHTEQFGHYASFADYLPAVSAEHHSCSQSQTDAIALDISKIDKDTSSQSNFIHLLSLPSCSRQTEPIASLCCSSCDEKLYSTFDAKGLSEETMLLPDLPWMKQTLLLPCYNNCGKKLYSTFDAKGLSEETMLLPDLSWVKQTLLLPVIKDRSWDWWFLLGLTLLIVILSGIATGSFILMVLAPYLVYCIVAMAVLIILCSHLFSLVIKWFCRDRVIRPLRSTSPRQQCSSGQHHALTDEKSHFQLIREDTNLYLLAMQNKNIEQGVQV